MTENQPFQDQGDGGPLATEHRMAVSADAWAQAFQADQGREPTTSEFHAAQAAWQISRDRDPSMQQMADGVKQFATGARGLYNARVAPAVERSGAKDFYQQRVAPAAKSAGERIQQAVDEASTGADRPVGQLSIWMARAPMLVPAAALGAAISLFLPSASKHGESVNFFGDGAGGEGGFALAVMLAVIAAAVAMAVTRKKRAVVTTGALSGVAGLLAAIDGFGNMAGFASQSGASVGIGSVLLGLFGLALLAGGALVLLSLRGSAARKG